MSDSNKQQKNEKSISEQFSESMGLFEKQMKQMSRKHEITRAITKIITVISMIVSIITAIFGFVFAQQNEKLDKTITLEIISKTRSILNAMQKPDIPDVVTPITPEPQNPDDPNKEFENRIRDIEARFEGIETAIADLQDSIDAFEEYQNNAQSKDNQWFNVAIVAFITSVISKWGETLFLFCKKWVLICIKRFRKKNKINNSNHMQ